MKEIRGAGKEKEILGGAEASENLGFWPVGSIEKSDLSDGGV